MEEEIGVTGKLIKVNKSKGFYLEHLYYGFLKTIKAKQQKKEMGISSHIGIAWKLGFFT